VPTRRGGLLYNFWRDAAHPRGLWRRTTLDGYRTDAPQWEVLLDLDALALREGEDWVWAGAATLPPLHERALLRLSRGGGDAAVLREYDLPTRSFPGDSFHAPEAKGGAIWLDADTLLLSSALGGTTSSGYASTVRLWSRGGEPAASPVLFQVGPGSMAASGQYERDTDRLLFIDQIGFFDAEVHLGTRAGPTQRLDLPTDSGIVPRGDWMAVRPRKPWTVGGMTYPADAVLGIGFDAFLAGSRDFATLFSPEPRRALQGFYWSQDKLVLSTLDDLRPTYEVVTPGPWTTAPLTGLPSIGTASAWPLDTVEEEQDGTLLATVQDPLTPTRLLLLRDGAAEPLKQAPTSFDAAGLVTTRHEAVSPDGTRVPYIQVGPPGATGDAPVHMTAYGGFGISLLPSYRGALGRLWLQPGGTLVVANLRGGGGVRHCLARCRPARGQGAQP
jgi:prolyl oligopeptidase